MGRTESLNLKNDCEPCGWYGHFNKSEMALFSECTDRYAQKLLDTADIVREAIYHSSRKSLESQLQRSIADKPVAHREQVPDAIRIPPAADASAATVADRAPAQFAVRTFIVRLMSQGSELRNREIHT
jgi:hypothetical protein